MVRDHRTEIPLVRAPALFEDPDPPGGTHEYEAACITKDGASAPVSCMISCPCKIEGLIVRRVDDLKIQVVWLPPEEGCCKDLGLNLICDGAIKLSSNVENQTEKIIDSSSCSGSPYLTVCLICTSSDDFKSSTCASLGDGVFVRADSNADGTTDISDAVAILGFLFLGSTMNDCKDAADVNDDGVVDISDPVRLLGFLFLGSERPPDPFTSCGVDSTGGELDCNTFGKCP